MGGEGELGQHRLTKNDPRQIAIVGVIDYESLGKIRWLEQPCSKRKTKDFHWSHEQRRHWSPFMIGVPKRSV